ncbi:uncharacterized protein [Apostichopus japonicus]|uniref:uncharacterized protein isoform X2 n=1 Tax=Stichopus japonicus TaxID=307972 RepID=UPI003AB263DA
MRTPVTSIACKCVRFTGKSEWTTRIFPSMARGKGIKGRKATMFQTGNKVGCKQKSEGLGETGVQTPSYKRLENQNRVVSRPVIYNIIPSNSAMQLMPLKRDEDWESFIRKSPKELPKCCSCCLPR